MTKNRPVISIITVCLNAAEKLKLTANNVASQTYNNIEYLIIDGSSSDNTLDVINSIKHFNCTVFSEPDNGIFQAMNKGIKIAKGDYITFLNAGDYYISKYSIQSVMSEIEKIGSHVFYGNIIWIDNHKNTSFSIRPNLLYDRLHIFQNNFPHPATFYKRSAFDEIDVFDESYRFSGDYEWNVRALIKYRLQWNYIDQVVAVFTADGLSNIKENISLKRAENERLRKKYFRKWELYFYRNSLFKWLNSYSLLRKLLRRILNTKTNRACS